MERRGILLLLAVAAVLVVEPSAEGAWAEFLWKSRGRGAEQGGPPPDPEPPAPEPRPKPVKPSPAPGKRTPGSEDYPYDARTGILPPPGEEAPDESKPMFNLWVEPVGDWLPLWSRRARGLSWDNDSYSHGVHVAVASDRIDSVEALQAAARKHPGLGSPITRVVGHKRTAKGWYAIVQHDKGKKTTLVYVRTLGGRTVTCWGALHQPAVRTPPTPKEDVIRLAESIRLLADVAQAPEPAPARGPKPKFTCAVKRLGALTGHQGAVVSFAYSRKGTSLVSGGRDKAVIVWDPATGQPARTLTGHAHPVCAVDISANGRVAVSGDADGCVKIWDLTTGREACACAGQSRAILSLSLAPGGRDIACASDDHTTRFWSTLSGRENRGCFLRTNGVRVVAFARENATRFIMAEKRGIIEVQAWPRIQTWSELCIYTREFRAAAISADAKLVAGGGESIQGKTGYIQLHEELGQMFAMLRGHDAPVTALAFSPGNRLLASGSANGKVKLWDPWTGQQVAALADGSDEVRALAFSPDGKVLTKTDGNTIALWGVTLRGPGIPTEAPKKPKATGKVLAYVRTFEGHQDHACALALSADARTLVSGGNDKVAIVWDVATGKLRHRLSGHADAVRAVAITADGRLAITGDGSGAIALWDARTGKQRRRLAGHAKGVNALALSADGKTLASASSDTTVKLWDVPSGTQRASLPHGGAVWSVALSADGRTMYTAEEAAVRVWEGEPLKLKATIKPEVTFVQETVTCKFRAVATLASGTVVLVGGAAAGAVGGPRWLFDNQGRIGAQLGGHGLDITSVAMTPKRDLLASASCDGRVDLLPLRRFGHLGTIENDQPQALMVAVALSADGKYLARTDQKTITLWRIWR